MADRGTRRELGVYHTTGNPFGSPAFRAWAYGAGLPYAELLEPFAGANHLIRRLRDMGLCNRAVSCDIEPADPEVRRQDTLRDFPKGFKVCVTNPPWLAKNSATARGLSFPDAAYDDLYKLCLERCLSHCAWVAALVPESFIRCGLFRSRLASFVSLTGKLFTDTDHPVGLALFVPRAHGLRSVWRDAEYLGSLPEMEGLLQSGADVPVRFNVPDGNVGLVAVDNTRGPTIRFCDPAELAGCEVKPSSRHLTRLQVDGAVRIDEWNRRLRQYRRLTGDMLLTAFRGLRRDGRYRRRLDWGTARRIINCTGSGLT